MKIAVLHKAFLEEEHKLDLSFVEPIVVPNKKEYCNIHNYEFFEDTTPNLKTHWNEDYWSYIPTILNFFETHSDIDWVFYSMPRMIISDMNRSITEILKDYPNKKILLICIRLY